MLKTKYYENSYTMYRKQLPQPDGSGFLQSFDKRLQVFSAGTEPALKINPMAVNVMKKAGIDISKNKPNNVDKYLNEEWDYVITVCDHANETCPVFPGKVRNRLHMGFEDPSKDQRKLYRNNK